jgi:hypothetical protein
MISQRCIVLGLVLGVKVFAGETQHPISDNGIQTSDDCHNAARLPLDASIGNTHANKISVYRIGKCYGRDGFL